MSLGPKEQPSRALGLELGSFISGVKLLTHCTYSNFSKELEHSQCIQEILLKEMVYL